VCTQACFHETRELHKLPLRKQVSGLVNRTQIAEIKATAGMHAHY